jgi:hypothetical protein
MSRSLLPFVLCTVMAAQADVLGSCKQAIAKARPGSTGAGS